MTLLNFKLMSHLLWNRVSLIERDSHWYAHRIENAINIRPYYPTWQHQMVYSRSTGAYQTTIESYPMKSMITSMLRHVCRKLYHGILFDPRLGAYDKEIPQQESSRKADHRGNNTHKANQSQWSTAF